MLWQIGTEHTGRKRRITMSDKVSQRSQELFGSGYYCAESVLLALAEFKGIQSDLIPKIASGFCSGISCTGGMCGAISGAIMGISLVTGRSSPAGSIESSYALTRQLIDRFEKQHGSINCRQLTGCDLATEAGQRAFEENHLMDQCQQYVGDAASIMMSLITDIK
jgi:C_GCAxxG_C_C family probable redox protein